MSDWTAEDTTRVLELDKKAKVGDASEKGGTIDHADANFIAESRTLLPRAVSEIERLHTRIERLHELLRDSREWLLRWANTSVLHDMDRIPFNSLCKKMLDAAREDAKAAK